MARMFPRTLRDDDAKSPGEETVFAALERGLDDEWDVYYSVGLLQRDHLAGGKDGEIDFVLVHPDRGVICLEVKGGDIECRHGEWQRRIDGAMTRVQDPFEQATRHKYRLMELIDSVDGWRGKDLLIGQALAFPDISVHSLVMAPDAPTPIVLDRHAMTDVAAAVDGVLAFHMGAQEKRRVPGEDGAAMLRDLLAPTFSISVPLSSAFAAEDAGLVELTRDQSRVLTQLRRNARMAVFGCAGSGKTMLAVEHARRLAGDGSDVLFVCFNKALGAHLHTSAPHDGVTYTTFHRLCMRQAKAAKVPLPEYPDGDAPPSFFSEDLPEALVAAMDELGPQWDALIVDEAQDLKPDWLAALRLCLRDEETAPVWLFLDDNQRIFDGGLDVPADFFQHELPTNCRNTQAIHAELLKLYSGTIVPDVRGPEGRPPELVFTDDQPATVCSILDRLLGPDEVPADDVVVLSSHAPAKSAVAAAVGDRVRCSSIRAFKGLEAAVVVLCELEDLDNDTRDQQLYVGLSRARNHVVVVAPPAA